MLPKPLVEPWPLRLSILEGESGDVGDRTGASLCCCLESFVNAESTVIGIAGTFVELSFTGWPPFAAAEELVRRLPLEGEVRDEDRRLPSEDFRSLGAGVVGTLRRSPFPLALPLLVPGLDRFPVSLL